MSFTHYECETIHIALSAGTAFEVRNSLYHMRQTEETAWRSDRLRQYAAFKAAHGRYGPISIFGSDLCLRAFAVICGGENYIRSCYRDLARMADSSPSHIDIGTATVPRCFGKDPSHRTEALRSYMREIIDQLAEIDPVSGRKHMTVRNFLTFVIVRCVNFHGSQGVNFQTVFSMYINDVASMGDEILYSESTVRRAWKEILEREDVTLSEKALLNKCDTCIQLKTQMLNVSSDISKII